MPKPLHRSVTRSRALWLAGLCCVLLAYVSAAWAAGHDPATGLGSKVANWFAAPATWQGSNGIPNRIYQHIWYTLISMAVSLSIALPIGIGLGHLGRGGLLAINVSNIGRAVPSFGLVILMFMLAGFGFIPVLVALVALAIPPILTNSYVGMRSVDPAVRQAAIAVGMTGWQLLWRVELPLALPLVMAGIRTSAVQVVSTATLAAYVGLGGLGRYLIDGLAQQQLGQVVGGAILAAILAVMTEISLAYVQRAVVSDGIID